MNFTELKGKLLAELSDDILKKLPPSFNALIDEAVESVIDGSSRLDGITPTNEDELLSLLRCDLLIRLEVFQGVIDASKKLEADNVTINYRGSSLKVK